MTVYLLVYLVVFVAPAGMIVHEMGHGVAAKFFRADEVNVFIGTGKHLGSFHWNVFSFHIYLVFFIGGMVINIREKSFLPHEKIWIALAGPMSNLVVVLLISLLNLPEGNPYILIFLLFQGWMAGINMIPFRWKGKHSDAYTVLTAWKQMK